MENKRCDGRTFSEVRPLKVSFNALGYADSSVLMELGNTKVLVSITLQTTVPPFLKGKRQGWLHAEYAMLPCATHQRTTRESSQAQRNSRSVEISRLIGRCLRSCINFNDLGERTIHVDCDVLQADGSTRVVAITAASLALEYAVKRWLSSRIIDKNIFIHHVAAISVGMVNGEPCLDLCYEEDCSADADFNIVMTRGGDIVEIQGTSEKIAVSWARFEQLKNLAINGIEALFANIDEHAAGEKEHAQLRESCEDRSPKPPLFSLGNRIKKMS